MIDRMTGVKDFFTNNLLIEKNIYKNNDYINDRQNDRCKRFFTNNLLFEKNT